MARPRAEAEAKEYARPSNTDTKYQDDEYTYEDLKRDMSIIVDILISTVATPAAVWMVASSWEVSERLALAFICSLVVRVAKVVIFWGYIRRIIINAREEEG